MREALENYRESFWEKCLFKEFEYYPNHDLTDFNSARIKERGDLIVLKSEEECKNFFQKIKGKNYKINILGGGYNIILRPLEKNTFYIKLKLPNEKLNPSDFYNLPASLPLSVLTQHALKEKLVGWEVFTGIPATLGGAVFMNAGTGLGEIGSLVKRVYIMNSCGETRWHTITEKDFSYRKNHFCQKGDLILRVELIHKGVCEEIPSKIKSYLDQRNRSQPMDKKTCGCVFKNPEGYSAGKLIDLLGLKGLSYGGFKVSLKHGNFIEHRGKGSSEDFFILVSYIQELVYLNYGIKLELEVRTFS